MLLNRFLIPAFALCATAPLQAAALEDSEWSGAGEFGYLATSGNTETQSLSAKLGLINDRELWRHTLGLEATSNSDNEVTTAERYAADWQSDYKITKFDYLFGRLSYETDKFSGYDYRTSEVLGYGRRVLTTDSMKLDMEVGAGARQSKLETGAIEHEPILRLAGRYAWQISPTALFTQRLSADIGQDATITKSITALKVDVVGDLAMKVSYTVENTSTVPVGVKETDTETMVSLVYKF